MENKIYDKLIEDFKDPYKLTQLMIENEVILVGMNVLDFCLDIKYDNIYYDFIVPDDKPNDLKCHEFCSYLFDEGFKCFMPGLKEAPSEFVSTGNKEILYLNNKKGIIIRLLIIENNHLLEMFNRPLSIMYCIMTGYNIYCFYPELTINNKMVIHKNTFNIHECIKKKIIPDLLGLYNKYNIKIVNNNNLITLNKKRYIGDKYCKIIEIFKNKVKNDEFINKVTWIDTINGPEDVNISL